MLYFGMICNIDPARGMVRVEIPELKVGDLTYVTEYIPFLRLFSQGNKMSIPFEANELVFVAKTEAGNWVVLGAVPNNVDKPYTGATAKKLGVKFSDGCLIEYDTASHKLTVNTSGDVNITANKATVTATEVKVISPAITLQGAIIKLDGLVTVTGALTAAAGLALTGGMTTSGGTGNLTIDADGNINTNGDVKAGLVSLKSHKHLGVTTGGGTSGTPTP